MSETTLPKNDSNLVWIDLEMTGLYPDRDRIIEIAVVVTDAAGHDPRRRPGLRHPPERRHARRDGRLEQGHARQERADRPRQGLGRSTRPHAQAQVIEWLSQYVKAGKSPMCGNSICQDRRFLANHMPRARGLLPLPQPRRQHAEGTGAALEARRARRREEGAGAHGAGRCARVDRRVAALPTTPAGRLGPVHAAGRGVVGLWPLKPPAGATPSAARRLPHPAAPRPCGTRRRPACASAGSTRSARVAAGSGRRRRDAC